MPVVGLDQLEVAGGAQLLAQLRLLELGGEHSLHRQHPQAGVPAGAQCDLLSALFAVPGDLADSTCAGGTK